MTVGGWTVEKPVPGEEPQPVPDRTNRVTEMPSRIAFDGPVAWDSSYTEIVVPEGTLPSVHNDMRGRIVNDSLYLIFSTGFGGVQARLGRSGEGWTGTARWSNDVVPHQVDVRSVKLTPLPCDSPPPVSIEG